MRLPNPSVDKSKTQILLALANGRRFSSLSGDERGETSVVCSLKSSMIEEQKNDCINRKSYGVTGVQPGQRTIFFSFLNKIRFNDI